MIKMVRKQSEVFLAIYGGGKMPVKRMINFMTGLLFAGIFCLNSGAFGYLSSGEAYPASEVVFIDPSVPEIGKIVAQLPQGAEVVRLSPRMDGVRQISTHLAKKNNLSAIHIISHGNGGHFVLNGKRIDSDFLRNYGNVITSWGRALAENGDILLYACNLAATDEGKAFVGKFAEFTDANVAASIDVTGENGDWLLEYSTGMIKPNALSIVGYSSELDYHEVETVSGLNDAISEYNAGGDTTINISDSFSIGGTPVTEISTTTPSKVLTVTMDGNTVTLNADNALQLFHVTSSLVTVTIFGPGTITNTYGGPGDAIAIDFDYASNINIDGDIYIIRR